MTTINRDTTRDIFRQAVLDALDEAARKVFCRRHEAAGATDADLPRLFAAIDVQIETLAARYGYVLIDYDEQHSKEQIEALAALKSSAPRDAMAEIERLRAALENILGVYAHDHHNRTAESLRNIAARALEHGRCGARR